MKSPAMKRSSLSMATLAVLGLAAAGAAAGAAPATPAPASKLPILKPGARLMIGDKPISVGHTACPEVLDWNNDGKKDLLVGTFNDGKVMLFLNRGTDAAPVFDKGEALQAGGQELRVGFG
jgi:hypothetical protein